MKPAYHETSSRRTDEGFVIECAGQPLQTPSGIQMIAPNAALAEAVAREWQSQDSRPDPQTMPLTNILVTAIDRARERNEITNKLADHIHTDLLCYHAPEPEAMQQKQAESWTPWLEWFKEHFGTKLATTTSLDALSQDPDIRSRIWNYAEALDEYYFAVFHIITNLCGSVVLSLAFMERAITQEELFDAAELEEIYHAELAGADDPVVAKRQDAMKRDLAAAQRFLDLLEEGAA